MSASAAVRARPSPDGEPVGTFREGVFAVFFGFQAVQTYSHAMDYRDDVTFWKATKNAVPNSAKAHLNYSVMKGARGDLETRRRPAGIALSAAGNP